LICINIWIQVMIFPFQKISVRAHLIKSIVIIDKTNQTLTLLNERKICNNISFIEINLKRSRIFILYALNISPKAIIGNVLMFDNGHRALQVHCTSHYTRMLTFKWISSGVPLHSLYLPIKTIATSAWSFYSILLIRSHD